jgi:hypothetical protein
MPNINPLNVLRRIGQVFTPMAPPAAAPGTFGPAAGRPHPDLTHRAAPGGGMAPRGGLPPRNTTYMRHDRLPPRFQSPPAFQHPGFGGATLRRPSGMLSPQAAQALNRLASVASAPVQQLLASTLPLLERLAGQAQHFQSSLFQGGHAAAHPAAQSPLAAALATLQRFVHDLTTGHLGGQAGYPHPPPQGFQPHPQGQSAGPMPHAPHAAPGGYGGMPRPQPAAAGPNAWHNGSAGGFHAHWGPAPNMHGPSAAPATPAAPPPQPSHAGPHTPVNVLGGSLAEARAALKASYGNEAQATTGMHRMAVDLKTAMLGGSTADLEAFQAKYAGRVQLPADFATDAAARARLAKVLNESLKAPTPAAGSTAGTQARPASNGPATGAAPPSQAAAGIRVFSGPTRAAAAGFDEQLMHAKFSSCPEAVALEQAVARQGFRYVGDTGSASKANTDFGTRQIRINAGLPAEVAALSLAYELANAAQQDEFHRGPLRLLKEGANDLPTAREYADGVLRKEARSVLMRSQVAIAMGRPDLVKNPRYNEIAQDTGLSEAARIEAVFAEVKQNGTVHQGKVAAFDHYVQQYLAHKDAIARQR